MNTNKQSFNWVLDAVLFIGFLLAFFLDLTGLDLHQWLGVGLGAFAGYHLLRHWDWVRAVSAKFFSTTQPRILAYYTIDAALLLGFFLITATGIVISSWLNLAISTYAFWKDLHVFSSIATLLLVVLKVGLHWRWIVKTAGRTFGGAELPRVAAPGLRPAAAVASNAISRRHFLTLMSVVGLASWAAVNQVVSEDQTVKAESETGTTAANTTASTTTGSAAAGSTTTKSSAGTTTTSSTCVVRCNKRCPFPGKCRKYVDRNKNGKCDLGECA